MKEGVYFVYISRGAVVGTDALIAALESGKVLAAIQVTPEAACGGMIAKIRDGDLVTIDATTGVLSVSADDDLTLRSSRSPDLSANYAGMGRELFGVFRNQVGAAESGASIFGGE